MRYWVRHEDGTWLTEDGTRDRVRFETIEAARAAAEDFAKNGDYGEIDETIWVKASIVEVSETVDTDGFPIVLAGDIEETVKVAVDPDEPECERDRHDESLGHEWETPFDIVGGTRENPGVWGHGGGVITTEVCVRCGCAKTTDTWATDPADGTQGHTMVWYGPGEYVDALDERHERRQREGSC